LDIKAVPDVITRSRVVALIESLGIDPMELQYMEFQHAHILAQVFATDENGKRYIDDDGDVVTHVIAIKIVEDESNEVVRS
jgi:hypothetical protein